MLACNKKFLVCVCRMGGVKSIQGITREERERGIVEGDEQRGVVEVMMAAPAPVTPWLCFPVQAVLGEGGRVRGESSRFGVGFGVRWRGTQGLQLLRMERKAVPRLADTVESQPAGNGARTGPRWA